MKKEELFAAIGDVDDALVRQAHETTRKKVRLRRLVPAACLLLIVGALAVYSAIDGVDDSQPPTAAVGEGGLQTESVQMSAAVETELPVGDRVAVYERLAVGNKGELAERPGAEYLRDGAGVWHRLKGADGQGYLIREEGGQRSLWIFRSFVVLDDDLVVRYGFPDGDEAQWEIVQTATQVRWPEADLSAYTYGEMLSAVYGVNGPEDIASVTSYPSTANNTKEGQAIQKKVGVHTYRRAEDIRQIYNALEGALCYGACDWTVYAGTKNQFTYSFSTDAADKLSSGEETYATRCLTLTLADGTKVESLKYNALKGCFYEFGGIGSEPLHEKTVSTLNRIFGIR